LEAVDRMILELRTKLEEYLKGKEKSKEEEIEKCEDDIGELSVNNIYVR
jgi:hypothetical protein